MNELQIVANRITAAVETKKFEGKEYLVAPVVLVKAGVLNGEYLPLDELNRYVEAWGDIAVPISHPIDAQGNFISAKSLDVVEKQVVGRFQNPFMDGNALKGEMWIDVQKSESIGGDGVELLANLRNGTMMEVSSAYFRDLEPESGEFNGIAYNGIERNLRPDHAAILLHETGACSCEDGCGFPRVNMSQDHSDSVMVAFPVPDEIVPILNQLAEQLPETAEPLHPSEYHVTLAYLGKKADIGHHEDDILRTVMRLAKESPIVRGNVNGVARFATDENAESDPVVVLVDSTYFHEWQRRLLSELSWVGTPQQSIHGFNPHITLAYLPRGTEFNAPSATRDEIVFNSMSLHWGDSVTKFELQGEAMSSLEANQEIRMNDEEKVIPEDGAEDEGSPQVNDEKPTEDIAANEQQASNSQKSEPPTDESTVDDTSADPIMANQFNELTELVTEFGGVVGLRKTLTLVQENAQAMAANAKREKESIISALVANERCAFSADDMSTMPLDQLTKLAQSLQPADYSGQGMALNHRQEEDTLTVVPMGGWDEEGK